MKKPIGKSVAAKKAGTRTAARKTVAASPASKNMLSAGIKAISNVHDEAIERQSRLFESILGLHAPRASDDRDTTGAAKPVNPLAAALDPFGFRKFEDVFDQRVARALLNLGVPTAEAMADLTAEVERLRAKVIALEAQAKKR